MSAHGFTFVERPRSPIATQAKHRAMYEALFETLENGQAIVVGITQLRAALYRFRPSLKPDFRLRSRKTGADEYTIWLERREGKTTRRSAPTASPRPLPTPAKRAKRRQGSAS